MITGNNDYSFTMVDDGPAVRLVVLGVGGMGNNAMENLACAAVPGLELYSLNTDVQALKRCQGSKPVQLGAMRTGGKGAGGNSDIGRMSAEDDSEKIRKIVSGAEMVFIASGMGGGTGSGAAPVVAQICRQLGILCVCVVTMPMECEGPRRAEKGRNGLNELRKAVDSLLIIENENLSDVMDQEDVSIIEVFRKADKVVVDIVASISKIINSHGYINLDLADLKNVLRRSEKESCVDVYIGYGEAAGQDRAIKASEIALSNPLLRAKNIQGASNLLVNVAGSDQIGHKEAMVAVKNVVDRVGINNQEIFMGVVTDNSMGDIISVTVIATGLPFGNPSRVKLKSVANASSNKSFGHDVEKSGVGKFENGPSVYSEKDPSNYEYDNALCGSYMAVVAPYSPLVRKDEWQIPAYIRATVKSSEHMNYSRDSRVKKIPMRNKSSDVLVDISASESQFRQPIYRMVG